MKILKTRGQEDNIISIRFELDNGDEIQVLEEVSGIFTVRANEKYLAVLPGSANQIHMKCVESSILEDQS